MANPVPTELVVTAIGDLRTTRNGNSYLPCDTNRGKVAFWADQHEKRNVSLVRDLRPPVKLVCGCIASNWSQHNLWIPQDADVTIADASNSVTRKPPATTDGSVSADDLSGWRRRLLRLLDVLEGSPGGPDGLIARITALKRQDTIPRETAPMMIALAELRNVSEHEGRIMSEAEGAVARNAWLAIRAWAVEKGIDTERL